MAKIKESVGLDKLYEKALRHLAVKYPDDAKLVKVMKAHLLASGANPGIIYAYCKTGLLVVEFSDGTNSIQWRPQEEQDEYYEAFEEFDELSRKGLILNTGDT